MNKGDEKFIPFVSVADEYPFLMKRLIEIKKDLNKMMAFIEGTESVLKGMGNSCYTNCKTCNRVHSRVPGNAREQMSLDNKYVEGLIWECLCGDIMFRKVPHKIDK